MAALRAVLLAVLLAVLAASPAMAQEATTGPADSDPLTRYDSPTTKQLAAEYQKNENRAAEIEAELEKLEAEFDFGPRRDALMQELADMPSSTQRDNALGDARLSDIESAPLPPGSGEKAAELRRKAESLDALDRWASTADIDIDSRLYGVLGGGEAEALARTYRREAGALEVAANSEEVAAEKKEAAKPEPEGSGEEEAAERETEPRAGGGGAARADDGRVAGEPAVAESSPAGGPSLGTLALLSMMLLGGAAYGLSVLSRRPVGRKLSGAWRARFGAMMASVDNSTEKPPEPPREGPRPGPPGEAPKAPTERPGAATAPAQGPGEPEGGAESPGATMGRVTPPARPSTVTETGSPDAEALAEWFSKEAPEEDPETPMKDPREAPAPRQDVNQMVAEEVARMRESGELGPDDGVVVTVEDGRIRVRRKG